VFEGWFGEDLARQLSSRSRGELTMAAIPVLLVEDEFLIAAMREDALAEGGFEVVSVHNGAKAMDALQADASRFRAIVTDIRMGKGPDGWEIGRHARELVPGIQSSTSAATAGRTGPRRACPKAWSLASRLRLPRL